MSDLIYHMLPAARWATLDAAVDYVADSLATEGFIHCTGAPTLLAEVANHFYRAESGAFVILTIDVARLQAAVRWEWADGHQFPHVYGPINRTAVVAVHPLPRGADGGFLPPDLSAAT